MGNILSVITYPFFPASNGGALRCFYLLRALAAEHQVYVLTVQPAADFKRSGSMVFPENITVVSLADEREMESVLNVFLPRRIANAIHARVIRRSLKAKANHFLLKAYPAVQRLFDHHSFDAVLYENLEGLVFLRDIIKRRSSETLHFLDAHNVDSSLWLQYAAIEDSSVMRQYAANALATEQQLRLLTDHVFTCSIQDAAVFQQLNEGQVSTTIIPNGVDVENKPFDKNEAKALIKEIIFCGALSTHANKEGLLWFYTFVFPLIRQAIPEVKLTVVGQVTDETPYAKLKGDPSVYFEGPVPAVQPYYERCSVSVVPLLSGSGTRLKILEAMSLGNPVVSTTKGAEGIIYEAGKELLIADDEQLFAQKVISLLEDHLLFHTVRSAARKLAEEIYDWRITGKKMSAKIQQLISDRDA